MKKLTISDIAKKAGVSKGTVSAVINGKKTVKSTTRNHVLKVMREMNFRPQGMARILKLKETEKTIGLVVKDLTNPFYTAVAAGVKEYATEKGYLVFIACSEYINADEMKITEYFTNKDINGAIIAPVMDGDAEIHYLFNLKTINFPFVLLEHIEGINANVVSIDNITAMKKAIKYLMETGHSKIVHFAGPMNTSHTHERIDGFRRAYSESPYCFNEDMIVPVGARYGESYKNTMAYFKSRHSEDYPSAILCFNDQQALGVLDALKKLKLRVPDDVSIVGNDDVLFSKFYMVPLTTIRAPMHKMGMIAAEILIKNIESPNLLPIENVILESEFIVRESTKVYK